MRPKLSEPSMTVLVVTEDEDAGRLLGSALGRLGARVVWVESINQSVEQLERGTPLVIAIDTAIPGCGDFLERVRSLHPWMRVYLMEDPGAPLLRTGFFMIPKPFDAAELAPLLVRECEAAALDKERRQLEIHAGQLVEHQRTLTRELEHAERLAAIGRIAASMAHEINNPLAVVQSSATYLRDAARRWDDEEMMACAEDIELAVHRIGTFVQHICGFSRRERPIFVEASIAQALEMAMKLVGPRARSRKVQLRAESPEELPVPHDPPRLAQAVLNLLSNAIDAAHEGGHQVFLRSLHRENQVIIQVDDDGPGISPEIRARLFEPFATTKPFGEGTGLGLSIAQQIVQDHRGCLKLMDRAEGPGIRAELCLSLFEPAAHKILVRASDPLVRRALVMALRPEHFSVLADNESSQTGFESPVHVVVIDTDSPACEESELTQVRGKYPKARLLGIVESTGGKNPGFDAHLLRPWNPSSLIAEVRRLCLGA